MRASYVVVVSCLLGGALGAGMSWANFHESPELMTSPATTQPAIATGPRKPKVLVDSPVHDFGAVERDVKTTHVFKVTNLGDAPLTLEAGQTTCTRCTITKLQKTSLAPGETTDVRVEYTPTHAQPRFRQHATILTNDPEHPNIDLTIVGTVASRYRLVPDNLVLSKVSANETKTVEIKIYAYVSDEISVEKYEFTGGKSSEFFEARCEPIPRDQLGEKTARSGCRVLVTLKPGLPLGPIRQTIRLELKLAGGGANPVVEVPIEGAIDSDISIVGRGWDSDYGRVTIGEVSGRKGATRHLFLVLRGPHRHEVTIKPAKIDPSFLKVTLGEPTELKTGTGSEGSVTQIPLSIEIPPGTPPVNRLGSDQGKYGEIFLETTHSAARQIRIYVQFVVVQ